MKLIPFLFIMLFTNTHANIRYLSKAEIKNENKKFAYLVDTMLGGDEGGDIVGNGAGHLEQKFVKAYHEIPRVLNSCLSSNLYRVNSEDRDVLVKISNIVEENLSAERKLVFVHSNNNGQFFKDQRSGLTRIAKTGFSSDFQIYINILKIYEKEQDFKHENIISILIHEIGHQVGISDHTYLDSVGSTISQFLNVNETKTSVKLGSSLLEVYSRFFEHGFSEIYFKINDYVGDIGHEVFLKQACGERNIIDNYRISNLSWGRPKLIKGRYFVELKGWINLHCIDEASNFISIDKDIKISFIIGSEYNYNVEFISLDKFNKRSF